VQFICAPRPLAWAELGRPLRALRALVLTNTHLGHYLSLGAMCQISGSGFQVAGVENSLPSPLGRGCPAAGALTSRSGTGEGSGLRSQVSGPSCQEFFALSFLRPLLTYVFCSPSGSASRKGAVLNPEVVVAAATVAAGKGTPLVPAALRPITRAQVRQAQRTGGGPPAAAEANDFPTLE
jgi:hypothetical protein